MGDGRAGELARWAAGLAAGAGVDLPDGLTLWGLAGGRPAGVEPVTSSDPAGALGRRMEAGLTAAQRRRGAHYTPGPVADRLVADALPAVDRAAPPVVCDPACGAGAVLLAAGRRLAGAGLAADRVTRNLLWGADLDPLAAAVTEAALALWSGGTPPAPGHVVAGDPLRHGPATWPAPPPGPGPPFGAVVGNPPFQGQLSSATARTRAAAAALARRFGPAVVRPYVDTAALFLLAGVELVRPGGRVVLVQPSSVAAGRDAAGVRQALAEQAGPVELWAPAGHLFEAAVGVCVPVLEVGRPGPADWGALVARAQGVPPVEPAGAGTLGSVAGVVAGFRDEYYGLVPHVVECPAGSPPTAPLVTSGLIDVGRLHWGRRPARFAKRAWDRPEVDRRSLGADAGRVGRRAAAHAGRLARPKVLVASQTRVLEAVADPAGTTVPATPVLSVVPTDPAGPAGPGGPSSVVGLEALLASPVVSAWAATRLAGTGLAAGALRPTAAVLAAVPLPVDGGAWVEGTAAFGRWLAGGGDLGEVDAWALPLAAAHGVTGPAAAAAIAWWRSRVPGGQGR